MEDTIKRTTKNKTHRPQDIFPACNLNFHFPQTLRIYSNLIHYYIHNIHHVMTMSNLNARPSTLKYLIGISIPGGISFLPSLRVSSSLPTNLIDEIFVIDMK